MKIPKRVRLIISTILITLIVILRMIGLRDEIYTKVIMIVAILFTGFPIFRKAMIALKYKMIGIDLLVTIATIGSLIIGEYFEAAAVTFLFMFGDFLEAKTIEKTRSSIKKLLDLKPVIANVIRGQLELKVNYEEIQKGDLVIVRPGEKIPVDGKVLEGEAYVNQSLITGEAIPVLKTMEDDILSGTIIESGFLIIEALKVGDDTTFSRILEMVEEAQDKKARAEKFIEKFSKYYTPAIIIMAIIFYLVKRDIYLSLTLLVIACPGALVISTPISIVAGIGSGAKKGVLFKGGEIIEKLSKVKTLTFDKTGTLTIGKPVVNAVIGFKVASEEVLRIAAIGESYSEHPIGKAIMNEAATKQELSEKPESSTILIGKGIIYTYQHHQYALGNRSLFSSIPAEIEYYLTKEEEQGKTAVILGCDNEIIGVISVADKLRDNVKELINNLRKLKIQRLIMLTGDNKRTAKVISEELNLDEYYSELLPNNKVEIIKKLQQQYGQVMMIGDGVNDAPSIATADIGVAIGGAGKDIAMETADLVLLSEDINKLSYAIRLSRAVVNNMRQNIIFAIITTLILLFGVVINTVGLSIGMLVHELSVLLVIINAMRLLGFNMNKRGK